MARILILGATGALGAHVVRQALAANHAVTAAVRTSSRLPDEVRERVAVHEIDLATVTLEMLAAIAAEHDAVVSAAGKVAEGRRFVDLFDRIVLALEKIPAHEQPVCWFLAGAGLLDVDISGRRGVDLPVVGSKYWPHAVNFARLRRSNLNWRLLCPGPMTETPPLGLDRLRVSLDRLPVRMPVLTRRLPGILMLAFFAYRVPEMIVSYADAAALMLMNIGADSKMARRRVGLALPTGLRGSLERRYAQIAELSQDDAEGIGRVAKLRSH